MAMMMVMLLSALTIRNSDCDGTQSSIPFPRLVKITLAEQPISRSCTWGGKAPEEENLKGQEDGTRRGYYGDLRDSSKIEGWDL